MISTLLAENPALARVLLAVALVASAALGALLLHLGRSRALLVLAIVGLIGVLALTVSPSNGQPTGFCAVQLSKPFQGIETLANVAMTVPVTLFAALWLRRPVRVLAGVSALSAMIELFQGLDPALGRSCDTNDWLMNTVGAVVGGLLAILIIALERRRPNRSAAVG